MYQTTRELPRGSSTRRRFYTRPGFTIVELLVVIVVIGILAAVTFVSYSGINNRAIAATMQSDLTSASTKLKLYQVENTAYPTLINSCPTPTAGNICLKSSPGNTYSYTVVNTASPQTYSLTETNTNGSAYVITHNSSPVVAVAVIAPVTQTFNYTGAVQTFTVPVGVTSIDIQVWGGPGGDCVVDMPGYGGWGGYVKGTLAVAGGNILNITVGTYGSDGYSGSSCPGSNGGNSQVNWPAASALLLATGGQGGDYDTDGGGGVGYAYAGVTNTSVSAGTSALGKVIVTYIPAS